MFSERVLARQVLNSSKSCATLLGSFVVKLGNVCIYFIPICFGELDDFPGVCMASSEGCSTSV